MVFETVGVYGRHSEEMRTGSRVIRYFLKNHCMNNNIKVSDLLVYLMTNKKKKTGVN